MAIFSKNVNISCGKKVVDLSCEIFFCKSWTKLRDFCKQWKNRLRKPASNEVTKSKLCILLTI